VKLTDGSEAIVLVTFEGDRVAEVIAHQQR
jgi:hypothetical protein